MNNNILKWIPNDKMMSGFYELKYIKDSFDSLCICLEKEGQVLILNWDGVVESYRRSTEEGRFAFISGEWQKIRKQFQNWTFFIMRESDYREWFYFEYGEFAEKDEFTHYMIVTSNFVIDVISSFEPTVAVSKKKLEKFLVTDNK